MFPFIAFMFYILTCSTKDAVSQLKIINSIKWETLLGKKIRIRKTENKRTKGQVVHGIKSLS